MAKSSGLGNRIYIAGYDLSGDVNSLGRIGGGPTLMNIEGVADTAAVRLGLLVSGEMSMTSWFNAAAAQEHALFSALSTADQVAVFTLGTVIGQPAACLNAKQINYDPTRAAGGALSEAVQLLSNAHGLHWGLAQTAGQRTDIAASNGAGVDHGAAQIAAVNIASVGVANPGQVNTSTAHGLTTGDSVVIAGTTTTPNINNDYPVTVVNATQFTIPVNVTAGQAGAGGTVQQTSVRNGCSLYVNVFSFTGTSITIKLQHSADNGVADAWADIAGATTAAISAAPTGVLAETATTQLVKRWVRHVSSGTFNPCTYSVVAARHLVAGVI